MSSTDGFPGVQSTLFELQTRGKQTCNPSNSSRVRDIAFNPFERDLLRGQMRAFTSLVFGDHQAAPWCEGRKPSLAPKRSNRTYVRSLLTQIFPILEGRYKIKSLNEEIDWHSDFRKDQKLNIKYIIKIFVHIIFLSLFCSSHSNASDSFHNVPNIGKFRNQNKNIGNEYCKSQNRLPGLWSFKDPTRLFYVSGGNISTGQRNLLSASLRNINKPLRSYGAFEIYLNKSNKKIRYIRNPRTNSWVSFDRRSGYVFLSKKQCTTQNSSMTWEIFPVKAQRGVYRLRALANKRFVTVQRGGLLKANVPDPKMATAFVWRRHSDQSATAKKPVKSQNQISSLSRSQMSKMGGKSLSPQKANGRKCEGLPIIGNFWSARDIRRGKYIGGGPTKKGQVNLIGAFSSEVRNPQRSWNTFRLFQIPGNKKGRFLQNTMTNQWLGLDVKTGNLVLRQSSCYSNFKPLAWEVWPEAGLRGVYSLRSLHTNKFVKVNRGGLLVAASINKQGATKFGWRNHTKKIASPQNSIQGTNNQNKKRLSAGQLELIRKFAERQSNSGGMNGTGYKFGGNNLQKKDGEIRSNESPLNVNGLSQEKAYSSTDGVNSSNGDTTAQGQSDQQGFATGQESNLDIDHNEDRDRSSNDVLDQASDAEEKSLEDELAKLVTEAALEILKNKIGGADREKERDEDTTIITNNDEREPPSLDRENHSESDGQNGTGQNITAKTQTSLSGNEAGVDPSHSNNQGLREISQSGMAVMSLNGLLDLDNQQNNPLMADLWLNAPSDSPLMFNALGVSAISAPKDTQDGYSGCMANSTMSREPIPLSDDLRGKYLCVFTNEQRVSELVIQDLKFGEVPQVTVGFITWGKEK
ncbi:hypothetical protein OAZ91_00875 [bacterium]|nr:hypothetical protein [bacterium]